MRESPEREKLLASSLNSRVIPMMSRTVRSRSLAAILGTLAIVFFAGCTETNTEYVERPQFNPPPDSVNGYMGYYNAATKQTTCGNCHVGYQGTWVDTAHADAYNTLDASGPCPVVLLRLPHRQR